MTDTEIAALRQQFGITSNGRGIKEFTQVADFAHAIEAVVRTEGAASQPSTATPTEPSDAQIRSLWQTTDTGDIEDDIMSFARAVLALTAPQAKASVAAQAPAGHAHGCSSHYHAHASCDCGYEGSALRKAAAQAPDELDYSYSPANPNCRRCGGTGVVEFVSDDPSVTGTDNCPMCRFVVAAAQAPAVPTTEEVWEPRSLFSCLLNALEIDESNRGGSWEPWIGRIEAYLSTTPPAPEAPAALKNCDTCQVALRHGSKPECTGCTDANGVMTHWRERWDAAQAPAVSEPRIDLIQCLKCYQFWTGDVESDCPHCAEQTRLDKLNQAEAE